MWLQHLNSMIWMLAVYSLCVVTELFDCLKFQPSYTSVFFSWYSTVVQYTSSVPMSLLRVSDPLLCMKTHYNPPIAWWLILHSQNVVHIFFSESRCNKIVTLFKFHIATCLSLAVHYGCPLTFLSASVCVSPALSFIKNRSALCMITHHRGQFRLLCYCIFLLFASNEAIHLLCDSMSHWAHFGRMFLLCLLS